MNKGKKIDMTITILTGAGASKALDYPTTVEFFTGLSDSEQNTHSDILNHLRQQLGKKILDVEDVLSVLQPIEDFVKTPSGRFMSRKLTDSWQQKIFNFANLCREKCFDLYGRDPDNLLVKEYYLSLLDICGWRENKITLFTTNYDPVTDVIMDFAEEIGVKAYDGFKDRGKWDLNG